MKINYWTEVGFSKLPFGITEKDIIYVESEYNETFNRFIQMYYDNICEDFRKKGYNFIYFPRLSDEVLSEILTNIYPNYEELSPSTISLKSNYLLNFLVDEFKQYYYGPSLLFSKFPPHNLYGEDDDEDAVFMFDIVVIEDMSQCFMTNDLSPILREIDYEINNWEEIEQEAHENEPDYDWMELLSDEDDIFEDEKNIEDSENEIDSITKESKTKIKHLITEIRDKISELNLYDKDSSVLRYHLRREVMPIHRLSNIRVTNRCDIIFTDYNIKLKLSDKYKALYLLYLNHPEGISYKSVRGECLDEFFQWYSWCTKKSVKKIDFYNKLIPIENREPITELIHRTNKEIEKSLGGGLVKKYGIYQINKKHQINVIGYKVQFDIKYHFRIDQTPEVKNDSSFLKKK